MTSAKELKPVSNENPRMTEYGGERVYVKDTLIQWEKGEWIFTAENGEEVKKETYSIWNPNHHKEIAQRLAQGQTCAMYVAGTYGVGKVFEAPSWQITDDANAEGKVLFDKIKKRPYKDNFVAFIDPQDQIEIIDIDRLSDEYKNLRWADQRKNAYAWAQHNIYPARNNGMIDKSLLRIDSKEEQTPENNSIACFWIPDHWGFEGIVNEVRKVKKHGIFGGGSLNFHGNSPGFTSEELYKQMHSADAWKEHIDFVIFDEICETAQIYRSQAMLSFMREKPTLLREGSLTAHAISTMTGLEIVEAKGIKQASSVTEYSDEENALVYENVLWARDMIAKAEHPLKMLAREDRQVNR